MVEANKMTATDFHKLFPFQFSELQPLENIMIVY